MVRDHLIKALRMKVRAEYSLVQISFIGAVFARSSFWRHCVDPALEIKSCSNKLAVALAHGQRIGVVRHRDHARNITPHHKVALVFNELALLLKAFGGGKQLIRQVFRARIRRLGASLRAKCIFQQPHGSANGQDSHCIQHKGKNTTLAVHKDHAG